MPEPAKETVIIVHGTFAAQDSVKRGWYEPVDGRPGGEPFPTKLDAALQARGSQARCWAHCTKGSRLFEWWPGENSWIARTRASASLGKYVADLQAQGWRCHIVAHSHGGNVVFGALPQIVAAAQAHGHPGTITTLGTPFIDTQSLILDRRKQVRSLQRIARFLSVAFVLGSLISLVQLLPQIVQSGFTEKANDLIAVSITIGLFLGLLVYAWLPQSFGNANLDDILPWLTKHLFGGGATGSAQVAGILRRPIPLPTSSCVGPIWPSR